MQMLALLMIDAGSRHNGKPAAIDRGYIRLQPRQADLALVLQILCGLIGGYHKWPIAGVGAQITGPQHGQLGGTAIFAGDIGKMKACGLAKLVRPDHHGNHQTKCQQGQQQLHHSDKTAVLGRDPRLAAIRVKLKTPCRRRIIPNAFPWAARRNVSRRVH